MNIKKFNELNENQLNLIINTHYNYWIRYNPKMIKEDTIYKFLNIYTKNDLPFGIALIDDFENIIGFCVLKLKNLKKYPEFYPWLSDVMILEQYRGKGYGKLLLSHAEKILRKLGYKTIYVWTDQVPDFYRKLGFSYKQKMKEELVSYFINLYRT